MPEFWTEISSSYPKDRWLAYLDRSAEKGIDISLCFTPILGFKWSMSPRDRERYEAEALDFLRTMANRSTQWKNFFFTFTQYFLDWKHLLDHFPTLSLPSLESLYVRYPGPQTMRNPSESDINFSIPREYVDFNEFHYYQFYKDWHMPNLRNLKMVNMIPFGSEGMPSLTSLTLTMDTSDIPRSGLLSLINYIGSSKALERLHLSITVRIFTAGLVTPNDAPILLANLRDLEITLCTESHTETWDGNPQLCYMLSSFTASFCMPRIQKLTVFLNHDEDYGPKFDYTLYLQPKSAMRSSECTNLGLKHGSTSCQYLSLRYPLIVCPGSIDLETIFMQNPSLQEVTIKEARIKPIHTIVKVPPLCRIHFANCPGVNLNLLSKLHSSLREGLLLQDFELLVLSSCNAIDIDHLDVLQEMFGIGKVQIL